MKTVTIDRKAYARQDLTLKLKYEGQLAANVVRPLEEAYLHITKNRLYTQLAFNSHKDTPKIRAALINCLESHYKATAKAFKPLAKSGFDMDKKTMSVVDYGVETLTLDLFRREAERQADIILATSVNQSARRRTELIALILGRYIQNYIDTINREADDSELEMADRETFNVMLAALASRAALIALVETRTPAEIEKLVTAAIFTDVRNRIAAGQLTAGQINQRLRDYPHMANEIRDILREIDSSVGASNPTVKTWTSMRDDIVRESHEEADGQTVPLEQDFIVDGEPLMYPGDGSRASIENWINCRCLAIYSVLATSIEVQ